MINPINNATQELMRLVFSELEAAINSDVLSYFGPIVDGNESAFLDVIETIAAEAKSETLSVILTTGGGSAMAVERYVNIIRKHYERVNFIVPDYAYSAGTIFCMSGDEILMDYSSVLGPIDPQVKNKEGKFVPALGYLDKIDELIDKAKKNILTNAEFLILKDFDLAELRAYEQARELTVSLLEKWLVKYKFKNWNKHSSSDKAVSMQEKTEKAKDIATKLGDNKEWKSHGRPINIEELEKLGLKIEDFSNNKELREPIRKYYNLARDYMVKFNIPILIQTRKFL
ncbi:MAG: serine dehydrogenasease [Bacteroidales bacterium]|nr:serine dehydrogenasease [Bacteroidales bacterium]